MMESKDIIKTLKHCTEKVCSRKCQLYDETQCEEKLMKNALDLIKNQQAEIKKLKEKHIEDDKLLNNRVTESVNVVSKAHLRYENALEEQLKTSETRAYNKFAELMLELYEGDIIDEMNCPVRIIRQNIKDIRDKLIEELTEKKED